ncbi:MAG: DEAD/DEAH box helicase, partial [Chryseobacterium sp.]
MFESAFHHTTLNTVIGRLTYNQFHRFTEQSHQLEIDPDLLRKSIWLASILANSTHEEHQKKVQLFGSLIFLQYGTQLSYVKAVYILFSRIGNLTATRFLKDLFENPSQVQSAEGNVGPAKQVFATSFGAALDLEVAYVRGTGIITSQDEQYLTTRFQKELWENLDQKKNVAVSGPTSSGKSFILKKHIQHRFHQNSAYRVLYIVPSKALINQVSEELRRELDVSQIDIRTAFITDEHSGERVDKEKEIFVLTPERCLKLLQYGWEKKLELDLIFVDEVQNLEDEHGRGSLFEYVLRELAELFPSAKIISAGPNIDLPGKLFKSVFGQDGVNNQTQLSPVFQMVAAVSAGTKNNLIINLSTGQGRTQALNLDTPFDLNKEFKKNIGSALSKLVGFFGHNQQNIIYAPQPDMVQDWALLYANEKQALESVPMRIQELIDFLKEEIHPQYYLIRCLRAGIAFHHSKLPDLVRKEIEDAFSDNIIEDLFCTATLIEGVNLPANNLFVVSAKKRTTPLTRFEFGNLIGRAGRIKDSLYGTIYCIIREGENWQEDYINKDYQKIVVPASNKALENIEAMNTYLKRAVADVPKGAEANTVVLLRQKYMRSKDNLINALMLKGLPQKNIDLLVSTLAETIDELQIPAELVRLNPSIDPLLQDILYRKILADGIPNWAIDTKVQEKQSWEEAKALPFIKKNRYRQLVDVMQRMDAIFGIWIESREKNYISISISKMCLYSFRWMENRGYGELIEKDLIFYAAKGELDRNDDHQVNQRINELIKIYSNVVSFICVKYLKLLMDLLGALMTDKEKEAYKFALALPTYLELGTSDP